MKMKIIDKLNLRPQTEDDYIKIFRWKISKPLAELIGIILLLVCLFCVVKANEEYLTLKEIAKRTYSYDSISLRLSRGHVRIRAEAGYIAYDGNVKWGVATGKGTLYRRDGSVVYEGEFEENEYSGQGTLYGENGETLYKGEFSHNLYEGEGSEYGIEGTVIYKGEFHEGKRHGKGTLYDESGNVVFEGNFYNGSIVYSEFLGKTTEQAAEMYTGRRDIYYDDECFVVDMKDIDAMYCGNVSSGGLEDTVDINKVFVISESALVGGKNAENIEEVREIAEEALYEGNVYISTEEAVALASKSELKVNEVYDNAVEITGYNTDTSMYIYTFKSGSFQYTFYSTQADGKFIMYSVERLEEER